jgi:hypothetical protein
MVTTHVAAMTSGIVWVTLFYLHNRRPSLVCTRHCILRRRLTRRLHRWQAESQDWRALHRPPATFNHNGHSSLASLLVWSIELIGSESSVDSVLILRSHHFLLDVADQVGGYRRCVGCSVYPWRLWHHWYPALTLTLHSHS